MSAIGKYINAFANEHKNSAQLIKPTPEMIEIAEKIARALGQEQVINHFEKNYYQKELPKFFLRVFNERSVIDEKTVRNWITSLLKCSNISQDVLLKFATLSGYDVELGEKHLIALEKSLVLTEPKF